MLLEILEPLIPWLLIFFSIQLLQSIKFDVEVEKPSALWKGKEDWWNEPVDME